jgi:cytochrome b
LFERQVVKSIRVWDLPVRLFHWLLVLSIIGLFVTQELGGNWMEWHKRLGFFVLGLVLFRLMWGVVGNQHARFLSFVRGPSAVLAYMRNIKNPSAKRYLGHNPMGALSVIAFLVVITFQAATGLFADDDIMMSGPYANAVSKEISDLLTKIHKLNSNVIIGLVVLHLAAIGFYFFIKRDNLVKPMITGEKSGADGDLQPVLPENARPIWLSWFCVVVAGGVTYALAARLFG